MNFNMIKNPSTKKILNLSIPAALNSFLDMVQILVDMLMVGRISSVSLAAIGLGMQIIMFLGTIITIFYVGSNALISRLVGAGELDSASRASFSLIVLSFIFAIPIAFLWYFIAEPLLTLLGALPEVVSVGASYLHILAFSIPLIFARQVMTSSLNSAGDTKTPFYIKLIAITLNIGLNYILIFGHLGFPALGVDGAAYATLTTYIVEFAIYIWLYASHRAKLPLHYRFDVALVKRALDVGVPAGLERMLTMSSFMFFTATITSFGTATLAGYQVGLRIEGLAFMPGIGFTIAAATLMGQNLGANNPTLAKAEVWQTTKIAMYLMGFLGIFMISIPEYAVMLFTDDAQTIKEASLYLRIVGLSQIPLAFSFVLSGALRGAGATRMTFKINLISLWCFRIIPAYLAMTYLNNILWVWVAMSIETWIKGLWLYVTFKKGEWLKVKV
jgi:putative MATE family efflux protein